MLLYIYHLLMCRSTRWYRNQLRKRERRFLQPKVKSNCNSDHSPFPHFPTVYLLPMAMIQTGVSFHPVSYAFSPSMPTAPGDDPWWHIEYAWTEQLNGNVKSCPTFLSDASASTHCLPSDHNKINCITAAAWSHIVLINPGKICSSNFLCYLRKTADSGHSS